MPEWVIALTGVAATLFAGSQLRALNRSNTASASAHQDQVEIERANLLLRLDEKYESVEIAESRRAWTDLRSSFEGKVAADPDLHDREAKNAAVRRLVSAHLTDLWKKIVGLDSEARLVALAEYSLLVKLINWFETVGLLCERNLVPIEDVLNLYDHIIIKTVGHMQAHVTYRAESGPISSTRQWENAVWLLEKSIAYKRQREDPPISQSSRATLKWGTK